MMPPAEAPPNRPAPRMTAPSPFLHAQAAALARHAPGFRSRYLSVDGPVRRVHLLEGGSGSPLLLVHGGGGVAAAWAPVLEALGERYHVVAVDRPGCGETDPVDYGTIPDYRAHAVGFVGGVLDSLGWRSANVLANSMGGYWSLEFALAHPERVERLVLAGAPAGIDRWIPPFLRLLAVPGVGPLLQRSMRNEAGIRRMFREALVADVANVSPEVLAVSREAFLVPGAERAWLSMLRRFLDLRGVRPPWRIREQVARLPTPTLFLWGEKDAFGPAESGESLARRMPKAQLDRVPGAGHLPWLDDPAAIVRGTRRWLG